MASASSSKKDSSAAALKLERGARNALLLYWKEVASLQQNNYPLLRQEICLHEWDVPEYCRLLLNFAIGPLFLIGYCCGAIGLLRF
jgi:hypothetical protein